MKQKKTLKEMAMSPVGIAVIVAIIVILYIVWKRHKEGQAKVAPKGASDNPADYGVTTVPPATTSPTSSYDTYSSTFSPTTPVKRGSRGETVKYVQMACNRVLKLYDKPLLTVDGIFGGKTETAVSVIMTGKTGSTSPVTYNQVKTRVIGIFAAEGKPNPYTGEAPSMTTIAAAGIDPNNISTWDLLALGALSTIS